MLFKVNELIKYNKNFVLSITIKKILEIQNINFSY